MASIPSSAAAAALEDPCREEVEQILSTLHSIQLKQSDYLSRCTRKCLERLPTYRDQVIETGVIQIVGSMESLLSHRKEKLTSIGKDFSQSSRLIELIHSER